MSNIDPKAEIYAILADNVYWDVRKGGKEENEQKTSNWTPVPNGWELISELRDEPSGFTARAFKNGNEVVIAYAGTNPKFDMPDYIADINMGLGVASQQANLAAEFYHDIKTKLSNATIKFTGHSLGGGLAGIMGVWFNKEAIVFDHAPFKQALLNMGEVNIPDDKILGILGAVKVVNNLASPQIIKQAVSLGTDGVLMYNTFADSTHEGVKEYLQSKGITPDVYFTVYDPDTHLSSRLNNITAITTKGELLEHYANFVADFFKETTDINYILTGETTLGAGDKHSQTMLIAALLDEEGFGKYATNINDNGANIDTLSIIFDKDMYGHAQNSDQQNFLTKLVRSHIGATTGGKDFATDDKAGVDIQQGKYSLLTAFGQTLKILADNLQPYDMTGDYQKAGYDALIAHTIEWHYHQDILEYDGSYFITPNSNTLQFTTAVADELLNSHDSKVGSYTQKWLAEAYLNVAHVSQKTDGLNFEQWTVALNGGSAQALDEDKTQVLITFGDGATFTAGQKDDLLFGYKGNDTLDGGKGADTLVGGAGFDTYHIQDYDTVFDSDGKGEIMFNGKQPPRVFKANQYLCAI